VGFKIEVGPSVYAEDGLDNSHFYKTCNKALTQVVSNLKVPSLSHRKKMVKHAKNISEVNDWLDKGL
jgi:hypothetical protein